MLINLELKNESCFPKFAMNGPQQFRTWSLTKRLICCEEFPKLYFTSDNVKVHLEKDHESMIYLCEKCDYHFGLPQALSLHIDTEHECVSYKCDQCNQIFCKHPHFYCVFNVDVDNVVVVFLIVVADAQSFSCPASNYS